MQTKGRVSPYTAVDWKRKFAQFPSTRRHIPRLPWPRLWRFRRLVHAMACLLFMTATTLAATRVQALMAPAIFADIDSQDGSTRTGDGPGTRMSATVGNRGEMDPRITIATNRDTIIGGMEDLVLTVTRASALDERLSLTVKLAQEQSWLDDMFREVTIAADEATVSVTIRADKFSTDAVESGNLTATVDTVRGYDTKDAAATAYVVSQRGPAIKVSFSHEVYRFAENRADPFAIMVAQAVSGMPRGSTVMFSVSSRAGTAGSPGDYEALSTLITVPEEDFAFENGLWQTQYQLPLTLIDDEVREGTERFDLILEGAPSTPIEVQLSDLLGVPCQNTCATPVEITDGEDIPALDLSVSPAEIMEEGETSSNGTVVSTNGKSFATDQVVTIRFAGTASQGVDYTVTPTDADEDAPDHQLPLPAGSRSVEMKLKAMSDEVDEPTEKIRLSATHDGNAIGSGTIRIVDRFPGPGVEITFEGVRPPRDGYDDGIATGPFTTRITFSEQVEGFTQEDIDWQTHSGTTVDTTNIGVLLWDYTEVRAGLEYTVRMMPTQDGRLHIVVFPDAGRSVATGDGNQLGHGSLQVELPPGRMKVEPGALAVDEGDEDGAHFVVLLTSAPTGTVTVTVSGMEGTDVAVNWPDLTFQLPYWSGGWGVTVTAGADANTRDETVTLTVTASGGGYDGQTANVVIAVRDTGARAASASDSDGEDDLVALVDDVTPEVAAAALFGSEGLSDAQLDALDLLGNRNGSYDLGDLLSWLARCERGEARCGGAISAADAGSSGPSPALPSQRRARGGRRRRRRTSDSGRRRRAAGSATRCFPGTRSATSWLRAALLVAICATWGCGIGDDIVQPQVAAVDRTQLEPGPLQVRMTAPPGAHAIGAMLRVEGPAIDSLQAPGLELIEAGESSSTQRDVIVAGDLAAGSLLQVWVPHVGDHDGYRVRLLQVAGEDYVLRDVAKFQVVISR